MISWNVNGVRSVQKKGFSAFVRRERPDVLCLQEVKATEEQAGLDLDGYRVYWNAAEKKGYSGTAILTRFEPQAVRFGMERAQHDREGRLITIELPDFHVVNVYSPNAQRGLTRLDYRVKEWEPHFIAFLKRLEKKKPVVLCGNLNVAHKEIDLANPKTNTKNAGFTPEERAGINGSSARVSSTPSACLNRAGDTIPGGAR